MESCFHIMVWCVTKSTIKHIKLIAYLVSSILLILVLPFLIHLQLRFWLWTFPFEFSLSLFICVEVQKNLGVVQKELNTRVKKMRALMLQPHFVLSVRMKLTLPKVGTWSPPGLPKTQSSISGVKTPRIGVLFIPLERS
jgi:hypothetical protein